MFITNFCFDDLYLSDFGCIVVSFSSNDEEVSGGSTEYDTVKAPNSDKFTFYGSQYKEPLSWKISIAKNPCTANDKYFNHQEERQIYKWLRKTDGYKWLYFLNEKVKTGNNYLFTIGDDIIIVDGKEETIYYQVKFDVIPHLIMGRTVGYDLTITANCAYGFTKEKTKFGTINTSTTLSFEVDTDANEYIYPEKFIINNSNGFDSDSFSIENTYDKYRKINLDTATSFINLFTKVATPKMLDSMNNNADCIDRKTSIGGTVNLYSNESGNGVYKKIADALGDYTIIYLFYTENSKSGWYSHGITLGFFDENDVLQKTENVNVYSYREIANVYETKDYAYISMLCDYTEQETLNYYLFSYSINYLNISSENFLYFDNVKSISIKDYYYPKYSNCHLDKVLGVFVFDKDNNLMRSELYSNSYDVIDIIQESINEDHVVLFSMISNFFNNIPIQNLTSLEVFYTIQYDSEFLVLDGENNIIEGLDNPNHFNWYFPRLVDGTNEFKTNSKKDLEIEIIYREARAVMM